MHNQRILFGADFKAKVALAAVAESKILAEFSSEYKVHSNQITHSSHRVRSTTSGGVF